MPMFGIPALPRARVPSPRSCLRPRGPPVPHEQQDVHVCCRPGESILPDPGACAHGKDGSIRNTTDQPTKQNKQTNKPKQNKTYQNKPNEPDQPTKKKQINKQTKPNTKQKKKHTTECNTSQHSTIQHNTTQHSTIQDNRINGRGVFFTRVRWPSAHNE